MIDISIVNIKDISTAKYDTYLSLFPNSFKKEVLRYRLEEDKYRSIAGKIAILNCLKKYTDFTLYDIRRNTYDRPYIPNSNIDFNISHSKNYVVCVFAKNLSVGVDIEAINPNINIEEFKIIFTDKEFDLIMKSKDSIEIFYRLWTIKEAVLKADGRGFNCNIKDISIDIENGKAVLENKIYNLLYFKIKYYIYTLAVC